MDYNSFNSNAIFRVDLHTHIMPAEWPDWADRFGYSGFVRMEHAKAHSGCSSCSAKMYVDSKFFREVQPNSWDPDVRKSEMDSTCVHVQVLSTVPVLFNYFAKPADCLVTSRFYNDHIAEVCQAHPDRFIGLGTLPMQDPELAAQELRRCLEIGLRGVEIGSSINKWRLDDPALEPFWAAAEELGAAVFVHPWEGLMGHELLERHWLRWLVGMPSETAAAISAMILGGVLERHPKLRVCFAHGGGAFPFIAGRVDHGYHCRPDLCAGDSSMSPLEYLGKIYVDSLVHDAESLRFLVSKMGSNRVCLGTDYPFPLGEVTLPGKAALQANLGKELLENVMHKNALDFLGFSREEWNWTTKSLSLPSAALSSLDPLSATLKKKLTINPTTTTAAAMDEEKTVASMEAAAAAAASHAASVDDQTVLSPSNDDLLADSARTHVLSPEHASTLLQ